MAHVVQRTVIAGGARLSPLLGIVAVAAPVTAILVAQRLFAAAVAAAVLGLGAVLLGAGDVSRLGGISGMLLSVPALLLAVVPGNELPVARLAGEDRVATAVAISRETHDRAPAVVLASVDDPVGAVAAAPLAVEVGGPLLLSTDEPPAAVLDEIDRLGASEVHLVGAVASDATAATLRGSGVDRVFRVVAEDVTAAIATRLDGTGAYVVARWEDGIAVAARAAAEGAPVLVTGADGLSPAARWWLATARPATVVVAGAVERLPDGLVAAVRDASGAVIDRVGGDRFDASLAVTAHRPLAQLWIASGSSWADAAPAAAGAAAQSAPLLLVPDRVSRSSSTLRWLEQKRGDLRHVTVVGGEAAVGGAVVDELRG